MPHREGSHQSLQQTLMGGPVLGLVMGRVEEEVGIGMVGNLVVLLKGILLVDHKWGDWELSMGVKV